jgi:nitrogen regulatory protein PII
MILEVKMTDKKMKALYIIVSIGFAELVVDFIRSQGATGATIINARGITAYQKEIMGISVDTEKEMVLTIIDSEKADKIIEAIKQKPSFKSEAHGICFTLPVEKTVGLRD